LIQEQRSDTYARVETLKTNLLPSQQIGIYIHIPFCKKRCEYCDFNTYAGKEDLIPAYVNSLITEIGSVAKSFLVPLDVNTIYFGGGTPSLLEPTQFERIFKTLNIHFNIIPNAEISLEANPGTIEFGYLEEIKNAGFNRLSLGAQSTNEKELQLLGRIHTKDDIFKSFYAARSAGFININIDLIYGLPDQTLKMWKSSLNEIIKLKPEHLSLYGLTIEKRTNFGIKTRRGLLDIPDNDISADMYIWSEEQLGVAGFNHYEISNWAINGYECRHNLGTWRNQMYLGFGAGAHGFANNLRVSNGLLIKNYINRIENNNMREKDHKRSEYPVSPATVSRLKVTRQISMQETMMLGLRLVKEGVSARLFAKRYGESIMAVFGKEITDLLGLNLLEWQGDQLILTQRGRLLGNQVFIRFI